MKLHVHGRGGGKVAVNRSKGARIAVALLATAALCLGPAAAASAEETLVTPTDTTEQALDSAGASTEGETLAINSSEGSDALIDANSAGDSGDENGMLDDSSDDAVTSGDAGADVSEVGDGTAAGAVGDASGDDANGDAASVEGTLSGDSSGGSAAGDDAEGMADGADDSADTSTDKKDESPTAAPRSIVPATVNVQGKGKGGDDNHGHQGIGICHATGSDSHPYQFIANVDVDSIFKENGHDQHTKAGGTKPDVIPDFWYVKNENKHEYTYPGNGTHYPGKNWLGSVGEYMLAHECSMPPEPPEVLTVGARDCLDPASENEVQLKATIGNLAIGEDYSVVLTKLPSTQVGSPYEFTASAESQQVSWWVDSAGSYRITATGPGDLSGSANTTVTNCPEEPPEVVVPEITLYYDDICAPRVDVAQKIAESKLWVELDDLVEGDEYEITGIGPNGYTYNDTITADGTGAAEFSITGLVPGLYQFTVTGPEGDSQSSTDSVVATDSCPPEPGEPVIEINPGLCVVPGEGQIEKQAPQLMAAQSSLTEIFGSNLVPGENYLVEVTNGGGNDIFSDYFEADAIGHIYATVMIYWPGSYIGTITGPGEDPVSASQEFEVWGVMLGVDSETLTLKERTKCLHPAPSVNSLRSSKPTRYAWSPSLASPERRPHVISVSTNQLSANGLR